MNNENEIWKDVPGYEGIYQVSNLGRLRSLTRTVFCKGKHQRTIIGIIKTPSADGDGYLFCALYSQMKFKNIKIHALVAMAFLNHVPQRGKIVVDHIDNCKTNNLLSNLQIITVRENLSKDKKTKLNRTSQYVGVHWREDRNVWRAQISVKDKKTTIGQFKTEKEAHEAYQKALYEINSVQTKINI